MNFCKALSIFICCGFIFLVKLSNSQTVPSNYNQPCLHAGQCNNLAGLYCIPTLPNGQHRCNCPTNGTIFDLTLGRCVGKLGYPCIYQGNQTYCPDKSHCSHQDPHRSDIYYNQRRCFCDAEYFANKDGNLCIFAAKLGESCSANKKCDETYGLKCIGGQCACEFGEDQYYDLKKGCLSFLGKNCSGFHSCLENARCDGISSTRRSRTQGVTTAKESIILGGSVGNVRGGRRINNNENAINNINNNRNIDTNKNHIIDESSGIGKCVCEYGFSPTKNGRMCLAAYKQICSDTQICNPEDDLECQDGSCNCRSPLHQIYNHERKKCVSLVGAPCTQNLEGSSPLFVDDSSCVNGILTCQPGFSKTPFRKCMKSYQQPCSMKKDNLKNDNQKNDNQKCNLYSGLACKSNKRCGCMDSSLIWNDESQSCYASVGSPCGKIGQTGDYGHESFYIACEPLSICKQEPGGDSTTSFCRLQKELI